MDASGATIIEDRQRAVASDRYPAAGRLPAPRLVVEHVDLRGMLAHEIAWADLAARALEPNIFLEPAFAVPLMQHLRRSRQPTFALVWEEDDETTFGRLVGLLPLAPRRFPGDRVARGFFDPNVCLGVPLLDAGCAATAWESILAWLAGDRSHAALSLRSLPREGAVFLLLLESELGARCRLLDEHRRACLPAPDPQRAAALARFRSAKRRKEMRRQRRRLAELGRRAVVSASSPEDVRAATERFLALEQAGWKGARGGALLAHPCTATFARSMTRLMAREGKCRIDTLEIDGRPVAMGIVLTAAGRAHFWKTAFDESFARLSPGVQLALAITDAQLADPSVAMTDSCAAPDHPMIGRLWPDRMGLADVLVDLRPGEPGRFAGVYALERFARAARRTAKTVWKGARRTREGWLSTRGAQRKGGDGPE